MCQTKPQERLIPADDTRLLGVRSLFKSLPKPLPQPLVPVRRQDRPKVNRVFGPGPVYLMMYIVQQIRSHRHTISPYSDFGPNTVLPGT